MDVTLVITNEQIMSSNYRGLQRLAKRAGIQANTRYNVLRRSLLRVSVPEASLLHVPEASLLHVPEASVHVESYTEGNFGSPRRTGLPAHPILVTIVSLFCIYYCTFRFPNYFDTFCWNLVAVLECCCAVLACCGATVASILCCEWTMFNLLFTCSAHEQCDDTPAKQGIHSLR